MKGCSTDSRAVSGWEDGKSPHVRSACATEQCVGAQVIRQTAAQRRANAAWLRTQFEELTRWIDGNPHRWPLARVTTAHRAILAGDDQWRLRAAEVLR